MHFNNALLTILIPAGGYMASTFFKNISKHNPSQYLNEKMANLCVTRVQILHERKDFSQLFN